MLAITSFTALAAASILILLPAAATLRFVSVPPSLVASIICIVLGHLACAEIAKRKTLRI
jgi:hypothetical protein